MISPMEDVCIRGRVEPLMAGWRTCWRRISAWPPLVRLEAGLREMVTMPSLIDDDPLQEISLYVDRRGVIHVHHPQAQSQEALILVANVLLKASQVVAAQAGAQVVSQPQTKAP